MDIVNAKQLNRLATIQKAINTPNIYGGFDTTFEDVCEIYVYLSDKKFSVLNSAGQRIFTKQKKIIARFVEIETGSRIVIDGKIYSVLSWSESYKGTQIEIMIQDIE